jgi:hypothetical protein
MDKQSVVEGHLPKTVLLISQAGKKNKTVRMTFGIMVSDWSIKSCNTTTY